METYEGCLEVDSNQDHIPLKEIEKEKERDQKKER
jgi:hypothetical protein